jgi:hypothetical protein
VPGGDRYWHGGGMPFEQVTVEPGGTTIVVLFLGGGGLLLLKLQPPNASGSTKRIRRVARMCDVSLRMNAPHEADVRGASVTSPRMVRHTEDMFSDSYQPGLTTWAGGTARL